MSVLLGSDRMGSPLPLRGTNYLRRVSSAEVERLRAMNLDRPSLLIVARTWSSRVRCRWAGKRGDSR